jgi:hypothetical protein
VLTALIFWLISHGSGFTKAKENFMGTYGLTEIIHRWGRGTLTVEQVIGQILLLLQIVEDRLRDLEHRPPALEQDLTGEM